MPESSLTCLRNRTIRHARQVHQTRRVSSQALEQKNRPAQGYREKRAAPVN